MQALSVAVNIFFNGGFSERAGKRSESLEVSESIGEAYEFIKAYLETNYGIIPPYIMLYEKRHIAGALKKNVNIPVKNGDGFEIMPSISGG